MSWSFDTAEGFASELAWARRLVDEKVAPLDHILIDPYDVHDPLRAELISPLQQEVKRRGLWAMHLDRARRSESSATIDPDGQERTFGQVEFALLNEILGRSHAAPVVFGCQAPDASNMEILHQFGNDEQRQAYFEPLAAGAVVSAFSVTEPHGGADPTAYRTTAVADGSDWVIDGEKWFSSNFSVASFALVLAVTHPQAARHKRLTMFIVPTDSPGIEVLRRVQSAGTHHPVHDHVKYSGVRVAGANVLGEPGEGFTIMANRMGAARLSLAARTLGQLHIAFEAMCEQAASRPSGQGVLADRQLVQEALSDSWAEIEQYRLLLLQTAFRLDHAKDSREVRADIAAVKILMPRVAQQVATRAAHLHGSLGASTELPFLDMIGRSVSLSVADGPTEVHVSSFARQILRTRGLRDGDLPSTHLPTLQKAARMQYAEALDKHRGAPRRHARD